MHDKSYFDAKAAQFDKLIKQLRILEIYRNRGLEHVQSQEIEEESYKIARALSEIIKSMYSDFTQATLRELSDDLAQLQLTQQLTQASEYLSALQERQQTFPHIFKAAQETFNIYAKETIDQQPAKEQFEKLSAFINSLKSDKFLVSVYWRGFKLMDALTSMDYQQRKEHIGDVSIIASDLKEIGLFRFRD